MDTTPRHLRAFLAVADSGGFGAAARGLGCGQSTVSALVRELETIAGAALFRRTTRRVELTAAGAAFRPRAAALLADLSAALAGVRALAASQVLTVATVPLRAATLLPAAIAALRAAQAAVEVRLIEAPAREVLERVQDGSADLGVATFLPGSEAGLIARPVLSDHLALFAPRGHRLAGLRSVAWGDLAGEPLVLPRDSALRPLIEAAISAAGLPEVRPAFEASHIVTALALVDAGLCVAPLPTIAARLAGDGVVMRRLSRPGVRRDVLALHRAGAPRAAEALAALLEQRPIASTRRAGRQAGHTLV
jgi:DNA-binding transcriptional LysR family regulator